jgi:chromosome segregation ATPase
MALIQTITGSSLWKMIFNTEEQAEGEGATVENTQERLDAFAGEVTQMRNELAGLKTRLSAAEEKNLQLGAELADLKEQLLLKDAEIASLKTEKAELKNTVTTLQTELAKKDVNQNTNEGNPPNVVTEQKLKGQSEGFWL